MKVNYEKMKVKTVNYEFLKVFACNCFTIRYFQAFYNFNYEEMKVNYEFLRVNYEKMKVNALTMSF